MTGLALAFMLGSWAFVLGLATWCFRRVLRAGRPSHDHASGEPETTSEGADRAGRTR